MDKKIMALHFPCKPSGERLDLQLHMPKRMGMRQRVLAFTNAGSAGRGKGQS